MPKINFKEMSLFKGPNFELSGLGFVLATMLAVVIGLSIYSAMQKRAQAHLVAAYHHANILCPLYQDEPTLAQGDCTQVTQTPLSADAEPAYNNQTFSDEQLLVLFKAAGIVDPQEITMPSDIREFSRFPAAAYLAHVMTQKDGLNHLDSSISTINMIVQLAGALGQDSVMTLGEEENQFYQFYLATAIANVQLKVPDTQSAFHYLSEKMNQGGFSPNDLPYQFNGEYWHELPYAGLVMSPPNVHSDADILTQLLVGKSVVKSYQQGWGVNSTVLSQLDQLQSSVTDEQRYQVMVGSQNLIMYLLSQLHSDAAVSEANESLVKIRGYEQAGMFFLAALILNIIVLRFVRRKCEMFHLKKLFEINAHAYKSAQGSEHVSKQYHSIILTQLKQFSLDWKGTMVVGHDSAIARIKALVEGKLNSEQTTFNTEDLRAAVSLKDDKLYGSRWVIRWAAMTLPALGFIGTVRGILNSLTQADSIVWATTQAQRADAISQLAGELGLAFATTFIALVAGIVVSFFNEQQTKSEGSFIQELESWAVSSLDIHLYELYGNKHHGE
ncbi:MotA/TolQ/ExbB proton channel family protein [Pseudoalteromonas sp. SSDWG2]|uniref:MotA/TolQ/ExbB proton channel family protein n=1 Tax=Pseudoalteromonas sp. SSDWG2 TaxID=3139391 RepID=UPI003BA91BB8